MGWAVIFVCLRITLLFWFQPNHHQQTSQSNDLLLWERKISMSKDEDDATGNSSVKDKNVASNLTDIWILNDQESKSSNNDTKAEEGIKRRRKKKGKRKGKVEKKARKAYNDERKLREEWEEFIFKRYACI